MKFEDWIKFDFRVGEIVEIGEDKIKIDIGEEVLESNMKLDINVREKIVVGIQEDKLIIPLIGGSVIVPESDIDNGSKVS